ncbi:MAG: hypothetical protein ACP5I8_15890 [Phycisphaerae bacterium]
MNQSKPLKSASLSPWMEVEEGMLLVIPRNHRRGHAPAPPPAVPPEAWPQAEVYAGLEVSIMAHYFAGTGAATLHRTIGTQAQSERNTIGRIESRTPSEGHVMLWGQSRPQCPQTPLPLLPLLASRLNMPSNIRIISPPLATPPENHHNSTYA